MTTEEVPFDAVLASVRSAASTVVPAPRTPADERDRDGWLPAGRYEVRIDDEATCCTDRRTL